MKRVNPVISKSEFLHRLYTTKQLVNPELENVLKNIKKCKVLEIGGIGIISEYLSLNDNEVRLCEEDSLYFDYRRQVVPNSKVIELNTNPQQLKAIKSYYDYVIIHSLEYEEVALRMSKNIVYLLDNKDQIEKIYEKSKYNSAINKPVTENTLSKKIN